MFSPTAAHIWSWLADLRLPAWLAFLHIADETISARRGFPARPQCASLRLWRRRGACRRRNLVQRFVSFALTSFRSHYGFPPVPFGVLGKAHHHGRRKRCNVYQSRSAWHQADVRRVRGGILRPDAKPHRLSGLRWRAYARTKTCRRATQALCIDVGLAQPKPRSEGCRRAGSRGARRCCGWRRGR